MTYFHLLMYMMVTPLSGFRLYSVNPIEQKKNTQQNQLSGNCQISTQMDPSPTQITNCDQVVF